MAQAAIADFTARTAFDPVELMPDEPSGAAAVMIATAIGMVILAGAIVLVVRALP